MKHVYYHVRNESPAYVQYRIQDAWGWCAGMTQRDDMGRVVGGGNSCTPMADSCQCMAKPIQYCKVKKKRRRKEKKVKVKVSSVVSDCYSMDCSLPGSSAHGLFQARMLKWVVSPLQFLQGIFPTQGSNPSLLHCR